jgi:hypothetical protein
VKHPFLGWIFACSMIGGILVIGGASVWQALGRTLASDAYPFATAMVMVGAWFVVCALTMIPKPHHGRMLRVGSVVAVPFMLGMLQTSTHTSPPFLLFGAALAVFPVAGAVLMLAAGITSPTGNRRAWLQQAWPGIVLVVVGSLLIAIVATRKVPPVPFYVPGTMLPAERGP